MKLVQQILDSIDEIIQSLQPQVAYAAATPFEASNGCWGCGGGCDGCSGCSGSCSGDCKGGCTGGCEGGCSGCGGQYN